GGMWERNKMTGAVDENKNPSDRYIAPPEPVAPRNCLNLIVGALGAVILTGYLMTSNPVTAMPTDPVSDRPLAPAYSQTTTGSRFPSAVTPHESSAIDLMKLGFAAIVALGWAVGGVWLGMRSTRASAPLHGPILPAVRGVSRAPTCA